MHFSTFLLKTWNFLLNDGAIFEHLNHVHVCQVASIVSNSVRPYGLWPTRLLCPWNSPGKNTGVGCHALLQGIFPTQGRDPRLLCLLHCWQVLYHYHWETQGYSLHPKYLFSIYLFILQCCKLSLKLVT